MLVALRLGRHRDAVRELSGEGVALQALSHHVRHGRAPLEPEPGMRLLR